ncbi:MAG: hypothetical protein HY875_01675 [Chloroflexi bacterium]|nr:hypothetical protein [Chloroflexota bacterium]
MHARPVLFPSPFLARPEFFQPLEAALRELGLPASVLNVDGDSNAEMIASAARQVPRPGGGERVLLVPHSGAGPLVPAVLGALGHDQAMVAFLDATLPHPGRSRLDELERTLSPSAFEAFERGLRAGGRWPTWTDAQLRPFVPGDEARSSLLGLVTPRPLSFFEEVLPEAALPAWLPCGYLRLSAAYDGALEEARARAWPTRSSGLTHFAPYTHPREVARELAALVDELVLVA